MHHFKESAFVPTPPKQPKKGGKKLIIAALVVMTGIASAAGTYAYKLRHEVVASPAEKPPTTSYFSLAPTFVVNLANEEAPHYLSADVQLVVRDEKSLAAVTEHAPAIRNRLVMLFGQQTIENLRLRSGKETLQKQALAETKAALAAEKASANVHSVIFTNLVTQ